MIIAFRKYEFSNQTLLNNLDSAESQRIAIHHAIDVFAFFTPIPVNAFIVHAFLKKPLRGPFSVFVCSIACTNIFTCLGEISYQIMLTIANSWTNSPCVHHRFPYQYVVTLVTDFNINFGFCVQSVISLH